MPVQTCFWRASRLVLSFQLGLFPLGRYFLGGSFRISPGPGLLVEALSPCPVPVSFGVIAVVFFTVLKALSSCPRFHQSFPLGSRLVSVQGVFLFHPFFLRQVFFILFRGIFYSIFCLLLSFLYLQFLLPGLCNSSHTVWPSSFSLLRLHPLRCRYFLLC